MREEQTVWQMLKKTKQRERVFRILTEADGPVSAADIYQKLLRQEEGCACAISTVYRILQAFEEKHLVSRTTLPDSDTAVYEWKQESHCHYAVCLKCHKRIPLKECPFHSEFGMEETFQVTGHKVEVYGYCGSCREDKR